MAKEKKQRPARLTKKEITQRLLDLFEASPGKRFQVKDLFAEVRAANHPTKMLVLDVLKELVLDDYLATDGHGCYYSAARSQVMEGTFQRKRNGHNSFVPDDGGQSILVCERNSLHALDGDRVRVTMLARRSGHTREAQVIEILERAKDTFVGELQVERGYGFLLTEDRSLATDIFIPRDKLKNGKSGDKAVVQIIEWPESSKSPIGKVVDILGRKGKDAEREYCQYCGDCSFHFSIPVKLSSLMSLISIFLPRPPRSAARALTSAVSRLITESSLIRRRSWKGLNPSAICPLSGMV